MIIEPDKKITPKAWQRELDTLLPKYEASREPYALVISTLASIEVLEYNRSILQSILEHETRENALHRKTEWGAK